MTRGSGPANGLAVPRMVVALVVCVVVLLPVLYVFVYALEPMEEIFGNPSRLWPVGIEFVWFEKALGVIAPFLWNSVVLALGTLALTLVISVPAAFGLSRLRGSLRSMSTTIFVTTQMFPVVMIAIPLFLVFNRVGLINSRFAIILADSAIAVPFCILILSSYMESFPMELLEAAYIDGYGIFKAFLRIVVPLSMPGIATVSIFAFFFGWSDLIFGLTLASSESVQPASVGLYRFIAMYDVRLNELMAAGFVYSLPVILIALVGGNFIVSGITAGAIKE